MFVKYEFLVIVFVIKDICKFVGRCIVYVFLNFFVYFDL